LARLTGQRALDVDEGVRQRALDVLHAVKVPAHWAELVERVVHLDAGERGQLFGESLPIGLRLVG
jgi:DNA-K related protein